MESYKKQLEFETRFFFNLSKRFRKMIMGENPLRHTTHDEKGLVLTIILFYPIF